MNKNELKEMAIEHWGYTFGVIERMISLAKYLYIQATIHGYKHGLNDNDRIKRLEDKIEMLEYSNQHLDDEITKMQEKR